MLLPRVFLAMHGFDDVLAIEYTHEAIDARFLGEELGLMPLHQAAGDDQLAGTANLLVFSHFEDGVDRFLLGGVDETAGVDHQDVGLVGLMRQLVASGDQLAHHDFAVDEILGATQTDKTDFHG